MNEPEPFANAWNTFADHCLKGIPEDSSQYRDIQKAFYAGAYSMLTVSEAIVEMPVDEDSAAALYEAVRDEVVGFMENLIRQVSERN